MPRDRYFVRFRAAMLFALISLAVMFATPLLERWPALGVIAGTGAVVCAGLALARARERALLRPAIVLGLLMVVHVWFWRASGQASALVLDLVGERSPSLAAPELLIVALAPLSSGVWALLDRHGLEPSMMAKLSLGFVLVAASWFCLGVGLEWGRAPAGGGLAICVVMLAVAALCMGPASLSAVDELGGGERAWLGAWVFGYLFARAAEASALTGAALVERCVLVGLGCVVAGLALAFAWRPITGLVHAYGRQPSGSTRRTSGAALASSPARA